MLKSKRNKILNICVAISFLTHIFFIVLLQTNPLWFGSSVSAKTEKSVTKRFAILEKISADDLLKEAFAPGKGAQACPSFTPQNESVAQQFNHSPLRMNEPPPTSFSFPAFPMEEFLSMQNTLFPIQSFQLPSMEQFDFFADLPKDLILPSLKKVAVASNFQLLKESVVREIQAPSMTFIQAPSDRSAQFSEISVPPVQVEGAIAKATPTIPMPSLPLLPSLADLQTVNLSDSFDTELTFLPKTDGPGYIFALTLLPHKDLNIAKIRQNIIFLVDRSNSIQRDRLQSTKHAIHRALEELNSDVQFNVIAFDTKVERLFPSFSPQTKEAEAKATRFIDDISLGSLFTYADLYKALFLTIPNQVQEDELYTAILLTDGESLSKKQLQRSLLRDWTIQNNGRVSLYALGITGDTNLASLDAACAMNKGKCLTSTTNRGLKRKLMKLAKNIRSPIAKNVISRAITQNPRAQVNIHLNPSHAPNLYLDESYVILGTTETLDDFILFVQARLKEGWLNIKKSISFTDAKRGGESLQSQWALQNAYRQYELFINDENPSHLAEAKKLLEPFDIQAIQ